MKKLTRLLTYSLAAFVLVIWGCDTRVTDGPESKQYALQGGLVKNLDTDSIEVAVSLAKNDENLATAILILSGDTIKYDSGLAMYVRTYDSASSLPAGGYTLKVAEAPWLNDSILLSMPNDFGITSIQLPEDRVNPGGLSVPIQWNPSLGSDGYIYAVALKDSIYTGYGFSAFVPPEEGTATSIVLDAFRVSGNVSAPDTGWYYAYIYSYTGSPETGGNLPMLLPEGFSDNISKQKISGRFGSIVVTGRDSIYVPPGK
jgi:hypothetical protein